MILDQALGTYRSELTVLSGNGNPAGAPVDANPRRKITNDGRPRPVGVFPSTGSGGWDVVLEIALVLALVATLVLLIKELPRPLTRTPGAKKPHDGQRQDQRGGDTVATSPNPPIASNGPPTAPASAAPKPMSRSVPPCAVGRRSASTASVTRVEPAMSPHDQPRPSRNRPAPSCTAAPGAAVPASRGRPPAAGSQTEGRRSAVLAGPVGQQPHQGREEIHARPHAR